MLYIRGGLCLTSGEGCVCHHAWVVFAHKAGVEFDIMLGLCLTSGEGCVCHQAGVVFAHKAGVELSDSYKYLYTLCFNVCSLHIVLLFVDFVLQVLFTHWQAQTDVSKAL